jgi:hypothetical protein
MSSLTPAEGTFRSPARTVGDASLAAGASAAEALAIHARGIHLIARRPENVGTLARASKAEAAREGGVLRLCTAADVPLAVDGALRSGFTGCAHSPQRLTPAVAAACTAGQETTASAGAATSRSGQASGAVSNRGCREPRLPSGKGSPIGIAAHRAAACARGALHVAQRTSTGIASGQLREAGATREHGVGGARGAASVGAFAALTRAGLAAAPTPTGPGRALAVVAANPAIGSLGLAKGAAGIEEAVGIASQATHRILRILARMVLALAAARPEPLCAAGDAAIPTRGRKGFAGRACPENVDRRAKETNRC